MAPENKSKGRSAIADVVAREYTIHLHKRVRNLEKKSGYERAGGKEEIWRFWGTLVDKSVNSGPRCFFQEEGPKGYQGD